MSRSNPTDNLANPCTRWFEWHGAKGGDGIRYYNKEAKENVKLGDKFAFLLLDELACVKGWHEASESGIFSNEVRDTRNETLVVKSFKGGELAVGFYAQIRDRAAAHGGHFVASLYIAYKDGGEYKLGNLQLKGAALSAWMDFKKAHRKDIYEQAIAINGHTEGKKGSVIFISPVFAVAPVSEEANSIAKTLDAELQAYLDGYFKKPRTDAAQVQRETEIEIPPQSGNSGFEDMPDDMPWKDEDEVVF